VSRLCDETARTAETAASRRYRRDVRDRRQLMAGSYYHLGSRGNFQQDIVRDDFDRWMWVELLAFVSRKVDWIVLSYCLMTNHFHLVIQAGRSNVSDAMQLLNGEFSRRANMRVGRSGHLFENRFHSDMIKSQAHLLNACRYVDLNPCAAGICSRPEQWPWGSYAATMGIKHPPTLLATGELLALFGRDPARARAAYREFVLSRRVPVSDTEFWDA
jgi:putative transposase